MKAVLYGAKSTEDKHGSIETQIDDCRSAGRGARAGRSSASTRTRRSPPTAATVARARAGSTGDATRPRSTVRSLLVAQHSDRLRPRWR